jgi:hypothetical protein
MEISSLLMGPILEVALQPSFHYFFVLLCCDFAHPGYSYFSCNSVYFRKGILFFGVESAIPVVGEAVKRKDLWKWAPKLWCIANGMGNNLVK